MLTASATRRRTSAPDPPAFPLLLDLRHPLEDAAALDRALADDRGDDALPALRAGSHHAVRAREPHEPLEAQRARCPADAEDGGTRSPSGPGTSRRRPCQSRCTRPSPRAPQPHCRSRRKRRRVRPRATSVPVSTRFAGRASARRFDESTYRPLFRTAERPSRRGGGRQRSASGTEQGRALEVTASAYSG